MANLTANKMSSRGQVIIPQAIGDRLHLRAGTHFVVMGEGDVVILKAITPPSMDELDGLLAQARVRATDAGLTEDDIAAAAREGLEQLLEERVVLGE